MRWLGGVHVAVRGRDGGVRVARQRRGTVRVAVRRHGGAVATGAGAAAASRR